MPILLIPRGGGVGGTLSPGFQSIVQVFRPGGVTGPSTALVGPVSVGVQVATPLSMFGIRIGMSLVIGRGTGNQETVSVTATTATTFTAHFFHTHAKGDLIDGALAGTQNFLVDLTDVATQITWQDLQQGGLNTATLQLLQEYTQISDIVAGNWLLMGFNGGNLVSSVSAGANQFQVTGFTDDLGNIYLQPGDVIMISDEFNTDLMTVTATAGAGSALWVSLGAAPGQPNSTLLNGYGANTQVARLAYQGIIQSRARTTRFDDQFIITANGMFTRYGNALGNIDIVKQDSGYAMAGLLSGFAASLPEIIVTPNTNFVGTLPNHTTGITATSQGTDTAISQTISDLLRQENAALAGTVYAAWVDQTRQVFHRVIPTTGAGSAPTWVCDLYTGGTGEVSADVIDTITTTDMDITGLVNAVIVTGGTPVGGVQMRIIVQDLTSIAQWGYYEGTLQNTNITDQTALANWSAAQLAILAYPIVNSKADFIVSSTRITARDLIKITGFLDASTMTINPVAVQYRIDAKAKTATATLTLGQLSSNAGSVMAEIAAQISYRGAQQQPSNNLIGTYVVSGFDLTLGVGPATEFTIAAGVVSVNGVLTSIPALTDDIRNYLTNGANGVQFGANPAGPDITQMPTLQSLSMQSAQYSYTITNGVISLGAGLNGLALWRITALADGTFMGTQDLRYWGGVNNNNAPPAGTTMAGTTLGTIVLTAEGLASCSASVPVTLPAGIVGASWLREISIMSAIAGTGAWSVRSTISQPASTSQTFTIHGLAAGQAYDLGIVAIALNGQMTAVQLLGTSPTISAAAIAAALLNYNEWSPTGIENADGSFTHVNSITGNTTYTDLQQGDVINIIGTIAKGVTTNAAGFTCGNVGFTVGGTNYELWWGSDNVLRLSVLIAGVPTVLATATPPFGGGTSDTAKHTFQLSIIVGNPGASVPNNLQGSIDGKARVVASDSSITLSSIAVMPETGGSTGTIRGYAFTVGGQQQPSSGGINLQGSIPPVGGLPAVNWSITAGAGPATASINFTTTATTGYFSNGETVAQPAMNVTFSGLTNSINPSPLHNYYFDVAFDLPSGSWVVKISAVDTPLTIAQQAADCFADGRVESAANLQITMPFAGGGSSGGSGGGGCPAVDQLIETLERGFVAAGELVAGVHLRDTGGGWNEILSVEFLPTVIWRIRTEEDAIDVNRSHAIMDESGSWVGAEQLRPGTKVLRYPAGTTEILEAFEVGPGDFASIECERHRYVLGSSFGHNATPTCPARYQQIETREHGLIRADMLLPGMHLRDPIDGWNRVDRVDIRPCDIWRIQTDRDCVDVNDTHMVKNSAGGWIPVRALRPGMELLGARGGPNPIVTNVELVGPGQYAAITCERQRYVLGKSFHHNYTY